MGDAGDQSGSSETQVADDAPERAGLSVTRRSFLIGAGAGAAATAVLGGAVIATKQATESQSGSTAASQAAGGGPIPATMRQVTLKIDGQDHDLIVDNRESLWETMNFQLGLSNSNLGCDRAQCGACTVLVDGQTRLSCLTLALTVMNRHVETVEGLGSDGALSAAQRGFHEKLGSQCGYCTPGFVMATVGLLRRNPAPSDDEIRVALGGNICRCTGYVKIIEAVRLAAGLQAQGLPP